MKYCPQLTNTSKTAIVLLPVHDILTVGVCTQSEKRKCDHVNIIRDNLDNTLKIIIMLYGKARQ